MSNMQQVATVNEVRTIVGDWKKSNLIVGLVPTMGAIHEGHLSLVRAIRRMVDKVIVSIFVNPLQFNNRNDFEKYQINIEKDKVLLNEEGVHLIFTPTADHIYSKSHQTNVVLSHLFNPLEGTYRPGHFQGVATIVSILFNIIAPDAAIFGEKDFQQLRIIEQLVQDMHYPIRIIRAPLIREESGLALSSRNERLSEKGKEIASVISKALFKIRDHASDKKTYSVEDLHSMGREELTSKAGFELEYLEIVDELDLQIVETLNKGNSYRCLIAGYVEGVRLIDNIEIKS